MSEESNRRRTPRVPTNFTATIIGRDASGAPFHLQAVSTVVSPGGASFSLDGPADVLAKLSVGQRVTVETTLGELEAEVNGVWTEPRQPTEGVTLSPHVGLRLLNDQTWMQPSDDLTDLGLREVSQAGA
jgi:hypothetical protein